MLQLQVLPESKNIFAGTAKVYLCPNFQPDSSHGRGLDEGALHRTNCQSELSFWISTSSILRKNASTLPGVINLLYTIAHVQCESRIVAFMVKNIHMIILFVCLVGWLDS